MNEDFLFIINWIIDENEKGYVDHPNDRGGPTKYGISLRYLQSRQTSEEHIKNPITEKDIFNLTKEKAIEIYYIDFWKAFKFDQLCEANYDIAKKVFDIAINMGPSSAIKILQKAINENNLQFDFQDKILVDGILGSETLSHLDISTIRTLLCKINKFAMQHYCSIVSKNPDQLPNLMGWYNRMAKMW